MEEMRRLEIEDRIKGILSSELKVDPAALAMSTSSTPLLGRGIGLDSVESLSLVVGIEKEFGIRVDDEDLTTDLFRTLGTLAEYVLQRLDDHPESSTKG